MRPAARTTARDGRVVAFKDFDRELVEQRAAARVSLERAVGAVPGRDFAVALQRVASRIVNAIDVETTSIWVRASDNRRELHLLAAEGVPTRDAGRLALRPAPIAVARSVAALGAHHSFAKALGLRWLHVEWLHDGEELVGVVYVGCRTDRRPLASDRTFLGKLARRLASRVAKIDRRDAELLKRTHQLIRENLIKTPAAPESMLSVLRPRERAVLELYAGGMGAKEIAELLVVSPHTVRTHVKHAFRRLGVHSRDEAAEIVKAEDVYRLL